MLPFALMLCWTLAIFSAVPGEGVTRPGAIPSLDPFAMIGLGVLTFLFMLAVAAPQLWWGWQLTSHYDGLHSTTTQVLRGLGLVLLLSPWWITLPIGSR